ITPILVSSSFSTSGGFSSSFTSSSFTILGGVNLAISTFGGSGGFGGGGGGGSSFFSSCLISASSTSFTSTFAVSVFLSSKADTRYPINSRRQSAPTTNSDVINR